MLNMVYQEVTHFSMRLVQYFIRMVLMLFKWLKGHIL